MTTTRKVVYTTPAYFDSDSYLGGGERYAWNMARGLVETAGDRYEVEIVSYGQAPRKQTLQQSLNLRILPVPHRPKIYLSATSWELADALADADLVHVHAPMTRSGEVAILVAKQLQKPLFLTDHGGHTSTIGQELGSNDLADRIICYSDFGASLWRTRAPVTVIKGGVDTTYFRPPAWRPPRDRILYVGRLLPHKGIDRLIDALPADLPLTICGRAYDDRYFELLRDRATGKSVEFVTDASDEALRTLYCRAWATVLPSVYVDCYGHLCPVPELMGLSLLESMACGTPAIGARVGGMPEFIREEETGFLFDTTEDLAEQLRRLADDPALADTMGERAREVAVELFDLRVTGPTLLALYEETIGKAEAEAA
jgi:glycosyltransferase involved in cell wall biosynthesis